MIELKQIIMRNNCSLLCITCVNCRIPVRNCWTMRIRVTQLCCINARRLRIRQIWRFYWLIAINLIELNAMHQEGRPGWHMNLNDSTFQLKIESSDYTCQLWEWQSYHFWSVLVKISTINSRLCQVLQCNKLFWGQFSFIISAHNKIQRSVFKYLRTAYH